MNARKARENLLGDNRAAQLVSLVTTDGTCELHLTTNFTVGCADLGAPFVNRLHMSNRRGAQCAPKKRLILRCMGAQCAPPRDNVCQSLDAVRRVGTPYGMHLQRDITI